MYLESFANTDGGTNGKSVSTTLIHFRLSTISMVPGLAGPKYNLAQVNCEGDKQWAIPSMKQSHDRTKRFNLRNGSVMGRPDHYPINGSTIIQLCHRLIAHTPLQTNTPLQIYQYNHSNLNHSIAKLNFKYKPRLEKW